MLTRLLTFLPLLLCPALMLVCMWAMRGMGTRRAPDEQTQAGQVELPTAARVTQLEHELAELRSRLPEADAAEAPVPAARPGLSPPTADGVAAPPGLTDPR